MKSPQDSADIADHLISAFSKIVNFNMEACEHRSPLIPTLASKPMKFVKMIWRSGSLPAKCCVFSDQFDLQRNTDPHDLFRSHEIRQFSGNFRCHGINYWNWIPRHHCWIDYHRLPSHWNKLEHPDQIMFLIACLLRFSAAWLQVNCSMQSAAGLVFLPQA